MLKFTSEIVDDVLFRCGEPTDGSSDFDQAALDYVNRAYRAIWTGGGEYVKDMNEPWLWLKKDPPGVLQLVGAYSPAGVSPVCTVTLGSATVSLPSLDAGSASFFNAGGFFFKFDTFSDMFRVLSATAGTPGSLTLDATYGGPSGTGTALIPQLEYKLAADVLRVISPMRVQSANPIQSTMTYEIEGCDLNALDRDYPLAFLTGGTPTRFAQVTEQKIRFNRYGPNPSALVRIEYDYLQRPADLSNSPAEEPLVPLEFRQVLADLALFIMFQAKSDARADEVGARAKAGLAAMGNYNHNRVAKMGRSTARLVPRPLTGVPGKRVLYV